jgi:hypothetical protein
MKNAFRILLVIFATAFLGMSFAPQSYAEARSNEQAVKRLQAKGAKFFLKVDFERNPLVQKTKGVVPLFSCGKEACTCTGVGDCIDLLLDSNICRGEDKGGTYACQETSAGPSCVCSR